MTLDRLKSWLVSLGPDHPLLRLAFQAQARRRGCTVQFARDAIEIRHGRDRIRLAPHDYAQVPLVTLDPEAYFRDVDVPAVNGGRMLDCTGPRRYRYKLTGIELHCPGMPEDDMIEAYLHRTPLDRGQVVWDVGAHAGLSTYHFAKRVGPEGHVFAFEPDDTNRGYLAENLAALRIENATVLSIALGEESGVQPFAMAGSMVSGFADVLRHRGGADVRDVAVMTLAEACERYGVPDLVKLDVEGAEVGIVRGSLDFLRAHRIPIAAETLHWTPADRWAYQDLDPLLRSIGYSVETSDAFGTMYTWAW